MEDLGRKRDDLPEEDRARLAAVPMRLLKDLYIVDGTKRSLSRGRCPDCRAVLQVIDTWERECPTAGCGYAFNLYHWPLIAAALPPEEDLGSVT